MNIRKTKTNLIPREQEQAVTFVDPLDDRPHLQSTQVVFYGRLGLTFQMNLSVECMFFLTCIIVSFFYALIIS